MSPRLILADASSADDLITFTSRAVRLGDGGVRLKSADGVLIVTSAPLAPTGLGDATPTILGVRILAADPELQCDLVVDAIAIERDEDHPAAIRLPDVGRAPAWAGVTPPQSGWAPEARIASEALTERADVGVQAVATGVPPGAGEDVVRRVRAAVWGRPSSDLAELPAGVAFVATTLGFVREQETAQVYRAPGWRRISLRRGHIMVREPQVIGLTPVRSTGTAS